MTAIIFDTEVNSLESKEVIELAWAKLDLVDGKFEPLEISCERFQPTGAFEAAAVATHHIIPDDLIDCKPSCDAILPASEYVIAHNVDFDCEVMQLTDRKRICTLAMCRHVWPTFKSHTLSSMYLELFGMNHVTVRLLKKAHMADTDVVMLADVLRSIIAQTKINTTAELYHFSEQARIPLVMPFGKHKGEPLSKVPSSYVSWLMGQPDIDPYLVKAFNARNGNKGK